MNTAKRAFASFITAATFVGCGGGVRPLVAGTDACDFCRMTVSDVRYGAEVVAKTGRVHTFDSIECAASWVAASSATANVRSIWVADYSSGSLIAADSALFVKGGSLRSPMGREIAAFNHAVGREALANRYAGEVLGWSDVVAYMRAQGLPGASRSTATNQNGRT